MGTGLLCALYKEQNALLKKTKDEGPGHSMGRISGGQNFKSLILRRLVKVGKWIVILHGNVVRVEMLRVLRVCKELYVVERRRDVCAW